MALMGDKCPLVGAVSISSAFDIPLFNEHIKSYLFGAYNFVLGYYLKVSMQEPVRIINEMNKKKHPERIMTEEQMNKVYTLTDVTDKILVKVNAFKGGVKGYYRLCNNVANFPKIKKPMFFISALDDPIMGNKVIPFDKVTKNVILGVTKTGGHVAHFEGLIIPYRLWYLEPAFAFLQYFINEEDNLK